MGQMINAGQDAATSAAQALVHGRQRPAAAVVLRRLAPPIAPLHARVMPPHTQGGPGQQGRDDERRAEQQQQQQQPHVLAEVFQLGKNEDVQPICCENTHTQIIACPTPTGAALLLFEHDLADEIGVRRVVEKLTADSDV